MRIEIPTGGKPIKDPDLKAVYLLAAALRMSTDRMVNANLEFAIGNYESYKKKQPKKEGDC